MWLLAARNKLTNIFFICHILRYCNELNNKGLFTVIELNVDIFFLLYLGSGFLLLFGLWFYYDWRDQYLFAAQRTKVIYHCIKCGQIYTGVHGSEESDCPQCKFTNGRLRF